MPLVLQPMCRRTRSLADLRRTLAAHPRSKLGALFEILSRSRMQTTRDLSPCSFTSARQSLTTRPAKKRDWYLRLTADIDVSCIAPQSHLNRQTELLRLTPTYSTATKRQSDGRDFPSTAFSSPTHRQFLPSGKNFWPNRNRSAHISRLGLEMTVSTGDFD